MKKEIPIQLKVAIAILVVGGVALGGEYLLVKWYPRHHQRVSQEALTLLPYRNDTLGIDMQIAAGLYGEVEGFPGGVRIVRPKFWSIGPALTITSQPNPDQSFEFTPEVLAKWQTQGTLEEIPRYHFERTKIQNRDAVLIRQLKDRFMVLTARVVSPERIVEADCTPGREDETLYLEACEESMRTIKVAGPEPPPPPAPGIVELSAPGRATPSTR